MRQTPADLVLTNGRVCNVVTGELLDADIAIYDDRIAGVGSYRGLQTLDLRGRIVLPGFVDAYAVLEASHLTLPEYARLALAHGTTSAVFDFAGIAAVLGLAGLSTLFEDGRHAPIDVYGALPLWAADVWETVPARFDALEPTLLSLPDVVARAGMLTGQALLSGDTAALRWSMPDAPLPAIVAAPGSGASDAAALAVLGVAADRCWLNADEALHKHRQGLWLLAEESSLRSVAADLRLLSRTGRLDRCCLVSGGRSVVDLLSEGHLDAALRRAVRAGIPAVDAVRMVTAAPAALLGLRGRGAVLPGLRADLVVVDNLRDFAVDLVIKNGRPAARHTEILSRPPSPGTPLGRASVRPGALGHEHLVIRGHPGFCRVIALQADGQTAVLSELARWEDGLLLADAERDVCKVAVVERHEASGRVGLGFVRGLGLRAGALCCSFAGAGLHAIAAGVDDDDLLLALERVAADEGGLAVAAHGTVQAAAALPYAGVLSPLPAGELAAAIEQVEQAAWQLGCALPQPFATLASLADVALGQVRLTEQGLIDVPARRRVPVQE